MTTATANEPDATAQPAKKTPVTGSGRFYRMTTKGLLFTETPSFSEWNALGKYLGSMDRSMPWLIGDWLIYGESRYGEAYAQAMDDTGLEYGTLRNYKYVANAFDVTRRRSELSFAHHYEVASMEKADQDKWLDLAITEQLTVKDLRYRIAGGTVDDVHGQPSVVNEPTSAKKARDWPALAREAWEAMTEVQRLEFRAYIDLGDVSPVE